MRRHTVTTYYNGRCPVCSIEIGRFRRLLSTDDAAIGYCDINAEPDALAGYGVTLEDIRRKLHVVDGDGNLLVGVPAFAALWDQLPGHRWLARLVRLPVVAQVASGLYDLLAAALYAWNRRNGRWEVDSVGTGGAPAQKR